MVEWKDGSSSWIPLADLKDAYPVQLADYAVANNVTTEPAFCWWVPFVLKKRDRILMKGQDKVLVNVPQIWIRTAQECQSCVGDRQENGGGLLEKSD